MNQTHVTEGEARRAEALAEPETIESVARRLTERLPGVLAGAPPVALERTVLAVAAMHDVDDRGRCRVCAECWPCRWRWWRRGPAQPCPTRRIMWAVLEADLGPRFTPA